RCDSASDFDVQHDFAIGTIGVAGGLVVGAVNGDGDDFRWSYFESVLEISLDVFGLEAAAELDNGDALAGAVGVSGEIVELGNLNGREGARGLSGAGVRSYGRAVDAKMRPRLWSVVETEDGGDDAIEPGGNEH